MGLSGPCGAKKPTRHPLRRSSSTSLFGAIVNPHPFCLHLTSPLYNALIPYLSRPHTIPPVMALDLAGSPVVFSPRRVRRSRFSPRRVGPGLSGPPYQRQIFGLFGAKQCDFLQLQLTGKVVTDLEIITFVTCRQRFTPHPNIQTSQSFPKVCNRYLRKRLRKDSIKKHV